MPLPPAVGFESILLVLSDVSVYPECPPTAAGLMAKKLPPGLYIYIYIYLLSVRIRLVVVAENMNIHNPDY